MSVWRPLFIKCIILDHKLQRMLTDSKIGQLNSKRPLHQTAVMCASVIIVTALAQVCIMWVEMFYCGSLGIWRIAEKQQRGLRLPQVILPSDLPC